MALMEASWGDGKAYLMFLLFIIVPLDFSKDFEGDANESNWPDVDSLDPYSKSKMLAEKEAWNFMDKMETRG